MTKFCPMCDQPVKLNYCKICKRTVKPYELASDIHLNESHDLRFDDDCEYHGFDDATHERYESDAESYSYHEKEGTNDYHSINQRASSNNQAKKKSGCGGCLGFIISFISLICLLNGWQTTSIIDSISDFFNNDNYDGEDGYSLVVPDYSDEGYQYLDEQYVIDNGITTDFYNYFDVKLGQANGYLMDAYNENSFDFDSLIQEESFTDYIKYKEDVNEWYICQEVMPYVFAKDDDTISYIDVACDVSSRQLIYINGYQIGYDDLTSMVTYISRAAGLSNKDAEKISEEIRSYDYEYNFTNYFEYDDLSFEVNYDDEYFDIYVFQI